MQWDRDLDHEAELQAMAALLGFQLLCVESSTNFYLDLRRQDGRLVWWIDTNAYRTSYAFYSAAERMIMDRAEQEKARHA